MSCKTKTPLAALLVVFHFQKGVFFMIKCLPMVSPKSGRAVANQYIIRTDSTIIFQSYTSTIAIMDKKTGAVTLGVDFDYSRTTTKYLHQFIDRYCYHHITSQINTAPGSSYTAKLRWCIAKGMIQYDGGLW